jgi:hypothetical protein
MSTITRSRTTVQGDITVNNGDIVISTPDKGVTMTDNVGDVNTLKIVDDGGVKTIVIEEQV